MKELIFSVLIFLTMGILAVFFDIYLGFGWKESLHFMYNQFDLMMLPERIIVFIFFLFCLIRIAMILKKGKQNTGRNVSARESVEKKQ